jgi:radical SAM-linked protein
MRIRIQFSKLGKVRFTSHRDVARIWERALRRAELPVAYSEGFNPRPKLSFGLALSTGHESDVEYIDLDLDPDRVQGLDLDTLPDLLSAQLPVGLTATAAVVTDKRMPSLQQAVTSCTWRIDVAEDDLPLIENAVAGVLAADEIVVTRERKGKQVTDDLRPLVFSLDVQSPKVDGRPNESGSTLIAELGTQPRAVRVSELLAALDPPLTELRVHRLHQWITTDDGQRTDPMTVSAAASATVGAT